MKLKSFTNAIADISKQFGKDMAVIETLPESKQPKARENRLKKDNKLLIPIKQVEVKTSPFENNLVKILLANHLKVSGYDFVLNNFMYQGSRMDVFCTTKDRVMEFAVLSSQEDYDTEFRSIYRLGPKITVNKHSRMKEGKALPNFFWMVISQYRDFKLDLKAIPSHCGIIYSEIPHGKVLPSFSIARNAPLLHNGFIPPATYKALAAHLYRRNEALNAKYSHGIFKIFNPDRDNEQQTTLFEQ